MVSLNTLRTQFGVVLSVVIGGALFHGEIMSEREYIGCIIVFRMAWIFLVFPKIGTLVGLYLVYPISWSLSVIALSCMIIYAMRKIKKAREEKEKELVITESKNVNAR